MVLTPGAVNCSSIEAVEGAFALHHILLEGALEPLSIGKLQVP